MHSHIHTQDKALPPALALALPLSLSLSVGTALSQIYFIINQLVAHLLACCLFSINKALIAFSLGCDLACCMMSFRD